MDKRERLTGGLYGLLAGDALGVPYEFHSAGEIPPPEEIEMVPPEGFPRAHPGVPAGTWSDDGAQALCLLDSLDACGELCLEDFARRLSAWYEEGVWAVDGAVFDVGIQTGNALRAYRRGMPPELCGAIHPEGKGNGALMRVLPLALWHGGTDRELVQDAHQQCLITHGHICNQVCCALYCLTARGLLAELEPGAAVAAAVEKLRGIYRDMPEYAQELEWSVRPDNPWEGKGSGYVVDTLRGAFMLLERAGSYEEAVRGAVALGDDTDTTACVAGGLAGVRFGAGSIPRRWMEALRGRDCVEELIARVWS